MSASAINFSSNPNTTAGTSSTSSTSSSNSSTDSLANENVFLQLLVAQLQYQDPTQPADGTEFVTQLAEFTNVSNTTDMAGDLDSMNSDMTTIMADLPASTTTSSTTTSTTPSNLSDTNTTSNTPATTDTNSNS